MKNCRCSRLNLLPLLVLTLGVASTAVRAEEPFYQAELIFPLDKQHNHAPGIVECPNHDLLVSWYRGSGERQADDVVVLGARQKHGTTTWSEPFLLADVPGFPDCNTAMMIDSRNRLWLFWPTIIANSWETCLTRARVSSDYQGAGAPKWEWQETLFLNPPNFEKKMTAVLDQLVAERGDKASEKEKLFVAFVRKTLKEKASNRLGWQPRCKPTVLPSGRILLPLYTDTYSVSLMAISDDLGQTWFASEPLVGYGAIQPAVLRRNDGTLVAYMRENGQLERIRVCESKDDGMTWGPVEVLNLPNPGSGLDAVRLANGHFALIYNDTVQGRNSLAVSISDDEGHEWRWTRHLEKQEKGSYHYPAIIQAADGKLHAVYSYFTDDGKSMKHVAFNEAWVQATE
ncbi:MAG: exo-alpha-sialidase [Planctomycetaceae bacterium]|nr:exo-alpha-sialidase [Planctomycetaceae bacterium]